jgi:uncharacterized DUF497 family protein
VAAAGRRDVVGFVHQEQIDTAIDARHADGADREARDFAFGRTDGGRLLTIVFTIRGELLRVISAGR